jgi:hypothetical protein
VRVGKKKYALNMFDRIRSIKLRRNRAREAIYENYLY